MDVENTQSSSITRHRFEFNESTNELFGVVETVVSTNEDAGNTSSEAFSAERLNESLKNEGYNTFDFVSGSLDAFLKLLENKENGQIKLAVKRDASITIAISRDNSEVKATTTAAMGGKPLTVDIVKAALESNQVDKRTVNTKQLAILISATTDQELIVAKSLPAVNGENTQFISLVEGKSSREKDLSLITSIDHKEAYDFIVVEAGIPVMEKIQETKGTPGLNVLGKELKAKAGKRIAFKKPFNGVEISPDNENILISTIKGYPTTGHCTAKVDPILVVDAVNASTGNITYDGALVVNKDIESGFTVEVTGDVLVKGCIDKATLKVGGNLVVAGGIQAELIDDKHIHNLHIGGNITSKFLNQCEIECLGNIFIDEYILHCDVVTKGTVNVGQEKGKGCIIGGSCKAQKGVNCNILGSDAYIPTELILASSRSIHKEIHTETKNLDRRKREEEQLSKMLEGITLSLEKDPTHEELATKSKKISNTIIMLNETIEAIEQSIFNLETQLEEINTVELRVNKNIYPNVVITINERKWTAEYLRNRTLIKEKAGKIVLGSF